MAYHHGNLREALVQAGLDILETEGLGALSLRGCAARVGVSHAAPKNHFQNLERLTVAICAEGHRRLSATMRERLRGAPAEPRTRIAAAAEGYLAFALENPDLFRLMFSQPRTAAYDPDLREAGDESHDILREICAPLASRINGVPVPRAVIETMVWSYVHGYASLAVNNRFRRQQVAIGRMPGIAEAMPAFEIDGEGLRTPCPPEVGAAEAK